MNLGWHGGILTVAGEIDVATAPNFTLGLLAAMQSGNNPVTVDLSECTFMDSTGIGALVTVLRSGHRLVLLHPTEAVRRVLQLSGLDELVDIDD